MKIILGNRGGCLIHGSTHKWNTKKIIKIKLSLRFIHSDSNILEISRHSYRSVATFKYSASNILEISRHSYRSVATFKYSASDILEISRHSYRSVATFKYCTFTILSLIVISLLVVLS